MCGACLKGSVDMALRACFTDFCVENDEGRKDS